MGDDFKPRDDLNVHRLVKKGACLWNFTNGSAPSPRKFSVNSLTFPCLTLSIISNSAFPTPTNHGPHENSPDSRTHRFYDRSQWKIGLKRAHISCLISSGNTGRIADWRVFQTLIAFQFSWHCCFYKNVCWTTGRNRPKPPMFWEVIVFPTGNNNAKHKTTSNMDQDTQGSYTDRTLNHLYMCSNDASEIPCESHLDK